MNLGKAQKQENETTYDNLLLYALNDVRIKNEKDWMQRAKFHADWIKRFHDVIVPFLKVL